MSRKADELPPAALPSTSRGLRLTAAWKKWFGVDEPTTEAILAKLKSRHENKKRWPDTEK
jgi:hypothetical protein